MSHRLAVLRNLQVGDLVYIPGHVMMVIGHENGTPYVIHDTTGISYRDAAGQVTRVVLNGVSSRRSRRCCSRAKTPSSIT
jgi:hypothetical protein